MIDLPIGERIACVLVILVGVIGWHGLWGRRSVMNEIRVIYFMVLKVRASYRPANSLGNTGTRKNAIRHKGHVGIAPVGAGFSKRKASDLDASQAFILVCAHAFPLSFTMPDYSPFCLFPCLTLLRSRLPPLFMGHTAL